MTHTINRDITRRQLLDKAGLAAASVVAISLGDPARAAAPSQDTAPATTTPKPDRRARVAEQWEDVLLLEAVRYLGLSKTQIQAMVPLAKGADDRQAKLWEQEDEKFAVLEPLVKENREALLSGKTVEHESDAPLHWRFLQQRREQVEEEIIQYVATRLARLLTRPQVLRAYLLARGGTLPAQVNSAALLDRGSGFVVDAATKMRWRDAVVKQQLARLYSPQVLSIDVQSVLRRGKVNAAGELVGETEAEQAALQAQTKKLVLETDWFARWEGPSGRALAAGTEEEQAGALYHFVRRTFLSSRITAVLTERAGQ